MFLWGFLRELNRASMCGLVLVCAVHPVVCFEKMEHPDGTKEHVAAQPPRDGHFSGRRAGFGRGGIGQAGRPAASRGAHPPPFHGAAAEDARRAPRHLAGFNHARSSVRIG